MKRDMDLVRAILIAIEEETANRVRPALLHYVISRTKTWASSGI